ncbi:MAG TPA: neutral zinc metallopeptidase [Candidatus Acidoferrum sp.]|nr:neutral zinc metallopeptidase [Candidatus Acidoferrum sp.]
MRWDRGRRSDNIEDRRGDGGGVGFPSGRMGGRIGIPGGRAGAGGFGLIAIVVVALLLGVDPSQLLQGNFGDSSSSYVPQAPTSAQEEQLKDFVSVVLGDTEDTWHEQFRSLGSTYEEPKLVLFSGALDSGCGSAQSAMGPFYCPQDHKVYLDLSFFQELSDRFGAPGDFAGAYVIAHEVGHHVQNLLGVMGKVDSARGGSSDTGADSLSVRLELQADCLAGVWARNADRARHILEQGDIEEAMQAAAAVGDDRLQREAQGYAVPDSFTHGTSEQRVRWFKHGFDGGRIAACDTFSASQI